jgi:PKD repeat protein
MTWGRKVGDPQWDSINTFEKMNNRLYNAYMRIADASDKAMVSPVGSVWAYVRQQHPTIELYSGDGSHPSLAGTYLSACVFHTALFRSNTTGATYLGGLDATTAGILQQAADHVLDSLQKFRLHPINEPTQALFNYTAQGLSIQFNNASYHAADYSWNFGDGSPSNITENPMHTYTTNGTYIVTLTANSICNSDTETMQLSVTTAGLQDEKNNFISVKNVEGGILIKSTEELVEIQVYTTDGRLIYHKKQLDSQSVFVPSSNQVLIIQTTTKQGGIQQIRVVS